MGKWTQPLGIEVIGQRADRSGTDYEDIAAADIQRQLDALTAISLQSRADGNLLWGRIQGTKYERQAARLAEQQLRAYGFGDVRKDKVLARRPLWRLDALDLSVTAAPSLKPGEFYRIEHPLTAYQSGVTPPGGVEAELVYVGEGTPAELKGRNLQNKIVLLRARGIGSFLFQSARVAFSRLAVGTYGMPAGVIVWADVPNAKQVAARVGSVGGGENLGLVLPWTAVSDADGYYLRKLIDRASAEQPVRVRLDVQGAEEGPDVRYSYNVYGVLPGQSGKYVMVMAHLDGLLYAQHCNGGSVAMNLALAKHYAALSPEERRHGMIFLFVGDHENPGVGATDKWIEKNPDLVDDLLVILRPEKLGMLQDLDEGWVRSVKTNVGTPPILMVTNKSPLLIQLFRDAIDQYSLAAADFLYADPAADETNFHPPYFDGGVISAGWATTTRYYHTTGDGDNDLVRAAELEKYARAHAYIIDALGQYDKADLERGGVPYQAEKSIYQSDALKLMFGNH